MYRGTYPHYPQPLLLLLYIILLLFKQIEGDLLIMKIYCNQEILLNNINIVAKACSSRTAMPILECILINAKENEVTLVGNNLEVGIESTFEADVTENGLIAIEAKIFSEIIKKMPQGEVEISLLPNNMLSIIGGKAKFTISAQPGEDFPKLPIVQTQTSYTLSQVVLKDMIRQTIFSVSQDETRPILTGEMFHLKNGELNLVSVDGFRISYRCASLYTEQSLEEMEGVVPGKALAELNKILSTEAEDKVTIYFGTNNVLFDLGYSKVVSRLLEGEFLKYAQVFSNDYETQITIDRKDLLMSIERAALISKEGRKNPIRIELIQDQMIISSNTDLGTVHEELDIELDGIELKIAFNPKYLIEALKSIDDDVVVINFLSAMAPCIIQPLEGNDYKYLILPIRVTA